MKKTAKKLVRALVRNPRAWSWMDKTVLAFARYADWMHLQAERPAGGGDEPPAGRDLLPSGTVLHGPFQGMAYDNRVFCCSAIWPKLLGSYEREIHPWLEEIFQKKYDGIVDVGCAEGYYAVGLAWKMKGTPVYAYDVSEAARAQCRQLAEANRVEGQVEIRNYCDPDELARAVAGRKFLVVSDCEGYEKQLFTRENVGSLAQAEILIEVHDFMDVTILPYLRELFAATHDVREAESIDDLRKLDRYDYPELRGRGIEERYKVIAEWRKRIMVWMYATPKRAASGR